MDNGFLNKQKRDIKKYLPGTALACADRRKIFGKSFFLDLVFLCLVLFSGLYVWSIVDSIKDVSSVTVERQLEVAAEDGLQLSEKVLL